MKGRPVCLCLTGKVGLEAGAVGEHVGQAKLDHREHHLRDARGLNDRAHPGRAVHSIGPTGVSDCHIRSLRNVGSADAVRDRAQASAW